MLFSVEFYNTPDGEVMVKEYEKALRVLSEEDRAFISDFLSVLHIRYPDAFKRLSEIYTTSERNVVYFEYRIVKRFVKCNFGEYDQFNYDIDIHGMFHFEEVRCPLRGECPHEGIICKPRLNTTLSSRELEVFSFIAKGYQAQEIADELSLSIATINRHRENIKAKIQVKSVPQMVAYWHSNNLK